MKLTKNINLLTKKEFLSIFGNIFEKSDWIADEVFNFKPFKDSNDLIIKMMNIYENSNNEKIIKIFNLHPQLAIEKTLTSFSANFRALKIEAAAFNSLTSNLEFLELIAKPESSLIILQAMISGAPPLSKDNFLII